MINCKNCGVELDEHMNFCPLCGVPVLNKSTPAEEKLMLEKHAGTRKLKNEIKLLNKTQKIKFFWEVISIILASGIISALVLDLLISNSFTWSLYVLTGAITLFLYVTAFSFTRWQVSLFIFPFISILSLAVLDMIKSPLDWSMQLGIPLLGAGWVIVLLLVGVVRYTKERGFNIIAYIFLAGAVLSVAIEGIISLYTQNTLSLSWSAIVFFSNFFIALVLLYIHFKLRKGTDLRKFFHI